VKRENVDELMCLFVEMEREVERLKSWEVSDKVTR